MIWIFIPAYNEELSIRSLVISISKNLSNHKFKILVIDDGSNDSTQMILSSIKTEYPLFILHHTINRGLGETERDGFEYIAEKCDRNDIIIRVEADATHNPSYLCRLIDKINLGYDVVNTSRFESGGGQVGLNFYRRFISRCANLFMKVVFNISGVKDYSCGYRAYRASVIKDSISIFGNNFIQLKGLGFTSTLEILVKLKLLGCRFAEVPFVLRYDLKQSSSKMISGITALGYLLMGILYHWPFGGWKWTYKKLGHTYNEDIDRAIKEFSVLSIKNKAFPLEINS